MSVLVYMAEQKAKIRVRHSGEEFFFQSARESCSPVRMEHLRSAEEILRDIDAMKGLNVEEREFFARRERRKKSGVAV